MIVLLPKEEVALAEPFLQNKNINDAKMTRVLFFPMLKILKILKMHVVD